jgi:rhomboid family GlyGly-CTERM serine protease
MIKVNKMKRSQARLIPGAEFPYLSLMVGISALLLFIFNDVGISLQYDRAAIAAGEFWRIITGHWIHWSFDHFLWCAITFVALGAICERLNRAGFILSLALSTVIIPVFCWFADPGMHFYRGLSGLCSSIFVVASIQMVRKARVDQDLPGVILPAVAGFLFFAKTLFEFINGQALFVNSTDIFFPVPLAHLAGALVGLIASIVTGSQGQRKNLRKTSIPGSRSCA